MKKTVTTIIMIITFLIVYFLQANLFSWFNLAGIRPNLFVILVLIIGLFAGESRGVMLGILFGISLDFFIGKSIGISGIMLGIVGFLGGFLDKNFSKDSRFTMIIMIIISTCLYEIGSYLFNYFINNATIGIWLFIKILVIENIFNVFVTIILYPLIVKLGYKLEKIFKENKILTRYF